MIKCIKELDSRADTFVAGATVVVIGYTGETCDVHPYNPIYKAITNVPIVKAVTSYDTDNSEALILCMNQALMPNSLLNLNQMCMHGIMIALSDCCIINPLHIPSSFQENISIPLEL
jgi:hypothetical protein